MSNYSRSWRTKRMSCLPMPLVTFIAFKSATSTNKGSSIIARVGNQADSYRNGLSATSIPKNISWWLHCTMMFQGSPWYAHSCFSFSWTATQMPWRHSRCSSPVRSKWLLDGQITRTFTVLFLPHGNLILFFSGPQCVYASNMVCQSVRRTSRRVLPFLGELDV